VAPPAAPAPAPASTIAIDANQIRDMMAAATPAAPPKIEAPPAMEFVPLPPPRPAAPPPPAAPAPISTGALSGGEDRPSTQFIPPAGLVNRSGTAAASTDESKKHDEARRFARLLVSEIKLYNETKVDQGRKNRDIYERLKEDIDRSRQMYDDRISEEVRKKSNYFYDELVRILAEGHAESLGL
jgi:hypothetical protein